MGVPRFTKKRHGLDTVGGICIFTTVFGLVVYLVFRTPLENSYDTVE